MNALPLLFYFQGRKNFSLMLCLVWEEYNGIEWKIVYVNKGETMEVGGKSYKKKKEEEGV